MQTAGHQLDKEKAEATASKMQADVKVNQVALLWLPVDARGDRAW